MQQRAECKAASVNEDVESVSPRGCSEDVEMKDATTSISASTSTKSSPTLRETSPKSDTSPNIQGPLPSQAAHTYTVPSLFRTPAPRLSLSTLPPVPTFTTVSSTTLSDTPIVATPSALQSPGVAGPGSLVNPSPAKKKLSLGDYMKRKESSTTPSLERTSMNLPEFSDSGKERTNSESRSESDTKDTAIPADDITRAKAADNEQAIEDVTMSDVPTAALRASPEVTKQDPGSNPVATNVQHMLSSLQQMRNKQDLGNI